MISGNAFPCSDLTWMKWMSTPSISVVIILLFVGFKWAKPQILRLKVWNWLEFEMRSPDEPEPPKRAIKPS
jgi:hypothetical protein